MEDKTQELAAAAAGMSVRSARSWESGPLPSEVKAKGRTWRTREDPFAEVWEIEVVPLLTADEAGVLEAKTVLAELQKYRSGIRESSIRASCGRFSGVSGTGVR